MSVFQIPNSAGQLRQDNRGDTRGELWETYSVDLATVPDKIKTSKKLTQVLDSVTDLGSDLVQAFEVYERNIYAVTDDNTYVCAADADVTDSANWSHETDIAATGITTTASTAVFGGLMLISQDTDITSWNGTVDDTDWWDVTISGAALTSTYPHQLHVHRGGQETLFVTDKNLVRYYNATAGHSTVTLQTDLVACCVSSGVSATWVGTYSDSESDAYVYEIYVGEQIDSAPVARNAYKIDGRAVLALEVIDNVPHIITDRGAMQVFNGAGFKTVASFPFAFSHDNLKGVNIGTIQKSNQSRPVHANGVSRYNESLYININTDTFDSASTKAALRTPSGVWEYNSITQNLSHRYPLPSSDGAYGVNVIQNSFPLIILNTDDTFLLTGGSVSTGDGGMYAESADTNQSYFITPEITANTVQEAYESAYIKAKTLSSGESIKLKYRTTKRDKEYFDCTFSDTNVLNTTDTLTNTVVGDEVTFSRGTHAGQIAHITDINTSATVTKLTLDTSIGAAGDTAYIVSDNFKLHSVSMTSDDGEYKRFGIGETSPWIQYKVVMLGDIEVRQFISKGNAKNEL